MDLFANLLGRNLPQGVGPALRELDFVHSKRLLGVARHAMNAGYALIEFVDFNREVARQTGIETIAIELSGLVDSGKLESVADTLHDSTMRGNGARLSEEGLGNLRRAERLLADAAANLRKYGDVRTVTAMSGNLLGASTLPAAAPSGGLNINLTEVLLIVTIGILIGILIFKKN